MVVLCRRGCGFLGGSTDKRVSKLRSLLHLTVCRLAILKNHRRARCNHARGDLLQLLQLGHRDRALLRAELVIKEENMLDVFAILEGYCNLLTERSVLLRGAKICPDELREAVSSLIYASSRLADLPEIYHVRNVFSSMFGKDFTSSAVEIRNCCGVDPKIVQKLSTRQPSLESRERITKEIAASKGINFDFAHTTDAQVNRTDSSARATHKYKDAVSAAQAAFVSAEAAAAAAKAAAELSRGQRKEEPNSSDKATESPALVDSTSDSDEGDATDFFIEARLNPDEDERVNASESDEDGAIELYFSNARLYPDESEDEDTFELPTLNISNSPGPLYQNIITGRRNRDMNSNSEDMGMFRFSYSSDTTSCQSKSGNDEAMNISPTTARRAVSVRTRRGLPR